MAGFDKILLPEMNTGQLATVLRDRYLLEMTLMNKVSGQPFKVSEIVGKIKALLQD